jgi:hypothetical protein
MKFDEREMSVSMSAHWKQAPNDALPAALETIASFSPNLIAGFRPYKVSPAHLGARAEVMLDTYVGPHKTLRDPLAQQSLQRQRVCVLSEASIDSHAASRA